METKYQWLRSTAKWKIYYFNPGYQALKYYVILTLLCQLFSQLLLHHKSFIPLTDILPIGKGGDLIKLGTENIKQYKIKRENKNVGSIK